MGGYLMENLLPEGFRDVYRKVVASVEDAEDERMKIALISVLLAVHDDSGDMPQREDAGSTVVPFILPVASGRRLGS